MVPTVRLTATPLPPSPSLPGLLTLPTLSTQPSSLPRLLALSTIPLLLPPPPTCHSTTTRPPPHPLPRSTTASTPLPAGFHLTILAALDRPDRADQCESSWPLVDQAASLRWDPHHQPGPTRPWTRLHCHQGGRTRECSWCLRKPGSDEHRLTLTNTGKDTAVQFNREEQF